MQRRYRGKRGRRRLLFIPLLLLICTWGLYHALKPQPFVPQNAPDEPWPSGGPDISVLLAGGNVKQMPLEEFVAGVVAAEMPASFALEALKAQAIVARTYVLSHSAAFGRPRHDNADICCDSTHCQAYTDVEALRERWGEAFERNALSVSRAVNATAGQAVFYGGALAETPYCSTCGGRTQAAADVWGADVPYLRSVQCLWDGHSPRASAAKLLSLGAAAQALAVRPAALTGMNAQYGQGGAITALSVSGKSFSGLELRQALGLDSAACQWLISDEKILFSTRGFGHGVGLCQYGADGMAKEGYTAESIITHYYQGVQLQTIY